MPVTVSTIYSTIFCTPDSDKNRHKKSTCAVRFFCLLKHVPIEAACQQGASFLATMIVRESQCKMKHDATTP